VWLGEALLGWLDVESGGGDWRGWLWPVVDFGWVVVGRGWFIFRRLGRWVCFLCWIEAKLMRAATIMIGKTLR